MNAPAAVRRQAKAADQMVRDIAAGKPIGTPPAAPSTGPDPNLPSIGAPLPADATPSQGTPSGGASTAPAPSAAPASAAPQPVHGEPSPAEPVDWEQRYRVLQGKYNTEVPRLVNSLEEARSIADQATRQNQDLILQLRHTAPAAPAPAPRREDTFQPRVTDQERQAFGDDLVDMIGRRAEEVVLPAVDRLLRERLEPIRQQVGRTAAETAQQAQGRVYAALNDQVPGWGEINESAQFLAWLEGLDVFSGASRRAALTDAFQKHDAPRVVGIFKAFQREDASFAPTSERQPQVDPETLVAPGVPRGGSSQEVAPGGSRGKIWTEGEVRSFYDRVRRKQVKPDEYQEVSAELAAAAREGRIKPDRVDIHMNQR